MGGAISSHIAKELTGQNGVADAEDNIPANYTLTGEPGGIEYIKAGTVQAMYNPFDPTSDYYYASNATGTHWVLAVQYDADEVLYRSDMIPDLTQDTLANVGDITIDDNGDVVLGGGGGG